MDPDRAWQEATPERDAPERLDDLPDKPDRPAPVDDADHLLDEDPPPDHPQEELVDPPPDRSSEEVEPPPRDRPKEVVEPPPSDRVEKAFPAIYPYGERPPIVKTERFRSVEEWVGDRNPGYETHAPSRLANCGDATRSCEYTWRGKETEALPINTDIAPDGEDPEVMDHWSPGDRVPTTFDDIERRLEELGPGSSAIVGIDYVDGGGHWFNAFNEDGRIVATDGQSGLAEDWTPGGMVRVPESACSAIDAIFIDASGKHLTREDLPEETTDDR